MSERSRGPEPQRGKVQECQRQVHCIQIRLLNIAGEQNAAMMVAATATLGELRAQIAASMHLGPQVKLSLALGERILSEAMEGSSLSKLGIQEGTALTLIKEPVRQIVTVFADNAAKIWSSASGECLHTLAGHSDEIESAAFSSDGVLVATASRDKLAKIWAAASGQCVATLSGHKNAVSSALFSPDSASVVTTAEDNTAKIWKTASGECLITLDVGWNHGPTTAMFSSSGISVVTTLDVEPTAEIWNVASGALMARLIGHNRKVETAVFSSNDVWVITASRDETAKIWNADGGKCLVTLAGHVACVDSAVFSPDNTRVATAASDLTTRIWDPTSGECLLTLVSPENLAHQCVNHAVFSSDGSQVLSLGGGLARIWSSGSGACLAKFHSDTDGCWNAVFSSDSVLVVVLRTEDTAQIWSAASGELLLTLDWHCDEVYSVLGCSSVLCCS